jgi:hypothetical protein
MNKALVAAHGNYGFGGEAIQPHSFEISQQKNWYIVEATVRILVDDDLD